MFEVAENIKAFVESLSPHYSTKIVIGGKTYADSSIYDVTYSGASTTSDDIMPGAVCSAQLTVNLRASDVANVSELIDKTVSWYINVSNDGSVKTRYSDIQGKQYGWAVYGFKSYGQLINYYGSGQIPMGQFIVSKYKKSGDKMTIECTDKLAKTDVAYVPKVSFPTTSYVILSDICNQLGIKFETCDGGYYVDKNNQRYCDKNGCLYVTKNRYETIVNAMPTEAVTMREMISFMTSMACCFAIIDRSGTLVLRWYTVADCNTISDDYISEPEFEPQIVRYTKIICKLDKDGKNTITAGTATGRTCEIYNPYMTADLLHRMLNIISGTNANYYCTHISQMLGDPRIDTWDILKYSGKYVPAMTITRKYSGGITQEIEAKASEVK